MANKRAVSLGGVVFDYKLYVLQLDAPEDILSEVAITEAGVHAVWQNKVLTPYITLSSKQHGWLSQSVKDSIIALYEQLDTTFTLEYDDGSTDEVRFAHENGISFTPLNEGCNVFLGQINLAKVV